MKILIEVRDGVVSNVWCSEPAGTEVFVRDLDMLSDKFYQEEDPLETEPGLSALRDPTFVIY